MTCDSIYDELESFINSEHEPYSQRLCSRALVELSQLLDTIRDQDGRIEGLVLENCDLRAQLMSANQMIEGKMK